MKWNRSHKNRRALAGVTAALAAAIILAACGAGSETLPIEKEVETPAPPVSEVNAGTAQTPPPTPTPRPTETPAPMPGGRGALYRRADASAMPTSVMDPSFTQDQKIKEIRVWFYDTEDLAKANKLDEHIYDENIRSWWNKGELVKAEVKEVLDPAVPDGVVYQYYYKDGAPYFAYIVGSSPHTELRLYFWNGILVRWMETDRVVHDMEENVAYAQYCRSAWDLYQSIHAAEEDM